MKNLLLFVFCGFSFCGFGQVNSIMPAEAAVFYTKAIATARPAIKKIIETNAARLRQRNINTDSLAAALKTEPLLKGVSQQSLQAIVVLVMVQVSRNADEELKKMVTKMRESDEQSSTEIAKGTEVIIGHKSRIAETVAGIMKKISPVAETAINNLR